jgi:hypothetical protein
MPPGLMDDVKTTLKRVEGSMGLGFGSIPSSPFCQGPFFSNISIWKFDSPRPGLRRRASSYMVSITKAATHARMHAARAAAAEAAACHAARMPVLKQQRAHAAAMLAAAADAVAILATKFSVDLVAS